MFGLIFIAFTLFGAFRKNVSFGRTVGFEITVLTKHAKTLFNVTDS